MREEIAKLYIDCDCGCDVLKVEKWDDDWGLFSLCMYKSCRAGFWRRLKYAWEYFKSGEFTYNDMIIKEKDLRNLASFLTSTQKFMEAYDKAQQKEPDHD